MSRPAPDIALAARLLDELSRTTRKGRGIERDTYGPGEQRAHDLARGLAAARGLAVSVDAIGNLTMAVPGRDRSAPAIYIGSHLDSVPQGGNFDGAAGVAAGLAIASGWQSAGVTPGCDIRVIALRGEESAWFDVPYIGSAGAFGMLHPDCLDIVRSDRAGTLAAMMTAAGFDPAPIRARRRLLDPASVRAYLELHIEQAPLLVARGLPAAVVTGIRGCRRFRGAVCRGQYGHSGALPRSLRHDAVAATVALLHALEQHWLRAESAGADLVITTGEFHTDPAQDGPSKVAGETRFVLDIRSLSDATMEAAEAEARRLAAAIGEMYRVRFDLGGLSYSPPAPLDRALGDALARHLPVRFDMASGAGHDAAVFASVGVPSAMIFVRNENGSHNPNEAMAIEDFRVATEALGGVVAELASPA